MSTITLPLNRVQHYIGGIGEIIVKEFLRENDIIIVAGEFSLRYINSRADFIITKNNKKEENFIQVRENDSRLDEKYLLAKYEGIKYSNLSINELIQMRDNLEKQHPKASIKFHTDKENNSLKFYDQMPIYKTTYEYIKNNLCTIEVKTSATGQYPILRQNIKTPSQRKHSYYDHILRVKLETNFSQGFKGTIHEQDVESLLNNPKLY